MNNFTIKLFLATIALNAVAFGAQQENILSILRRRQLGERDHGLQKFVDAKLRPYVEKEIPQEELPITFNDYQRVKGVTIIGLTIPKELSPKGMRPILFSTSGYDIRQANSAIEMASINNLNGIECVRVYKLDGYPMAEELASGEDLAMVEALCFSNMNITISMSEAKRLKEIFPMLTHISLMSSVEGRQNAKNIDAAKLGLTISYMNRAY